MKPITLRGLVALTTASWIVVAVLAGLLVQTNRQLKTQKKVSELRLMEAEIERQSRKESDEVLLTCITEWRKSLRQSYRLAEQESLIDELARRIADQMESNKVHKSR